MILKTNPSELLTRIKLFILQGLEHHQGFQSQRFNAKIHEKRGAHKNCSCQGLSKQTILQHSKITKISVLNIEHGH